MTQLTSLRTPFYRRDISVGMGLTTMNFARVITSGYRTATITEIKKYVKHRATMEASPIYGHVAWTHLSIYAVHYTDKIKRKRPFCIALPAVAEIGSILTVIPSMKEFQYQWNGRGYSWVGAS